MVALKARALLYQKIRSFFLARGILEVETPLLCQTGATDVHLQSVVALRHMFGHKQTHYLQTSPEFAMKRLLASGVFTGCDDIKGIYQLAKAFRDDEHGRRHNSEFSLLEWYLPYASLEVLLAQVIDLLSVCFDEPLTVNKLSYKAAFKAVLDIDPLTAELDTLKQVVHSFGLPAPLGGDSDKVGYLDLLFSHLVEPTLSKDDDTKTITVLSEFPAAMASLAKVHHDEAGEQVASRFEIYMGGLELANAYDELLDDKLLLARFCEDNIQRQRLGLATMPIDERLLQALPTMPPCSGVALGVDRLLMVLLGRHQLDDVITFTAEQA